MLQVEFIPELDLRESLTPHPSFGHPLPIDGRGSQFDLLKQANGIWVLPIAKIPPWLGASLP